MDIAILLRFLLLCMHILTSYRFTYAANFQLQTVLIIIVVIYSYKNELTNTTKEWIMPKNYELAAAFIQVGSFCALIFVMGFVTFPVY